MMSRELPTAFFMDNPAKITKAGIIKNPPPAPRKPVTIPTIRPIKTSFGRFCLSTTAAFDFRIIDREAKIINTANTNINSMPLVR